jgi:chaperone required for assembly of F1-ATPase
MRDFLRDGLAPSSRDSTEAARRNMRPALRRRFYQQVRVEDDGALFRVVLDGRPAKTPAQRIVRVPSRALAEVVAAEWEAQEGVIDPAKMPLNRLANTIIDGVAQSHCAVAAEVEKYLGSDLVLYRADAPRGLAERQAAAWDPVLTWAREALRAQFQPTHCMTHAAQSPQAMRAAAAAIPSDPWRLGALHALTTLTGSALIALALAGGRLSLADAWSAAHVDEDWNMETWGRDDMALEARSYRFAEMQAAAEVMRLVPSSPDVSE